ncbi:MAG: ATP-dependent helicase HrpB [Phenylobacterium sp.]|uniref:ATP-dependent helicase HrpB n=1 Tax=Phenylobacterium sp. TaxID=1871053 RepID=UPI001B4FCEF1|nr:ATP-dependent helicase HrpB [Phenylobacterium sp.]MBP7815065.1 ATP-dependent helicase HrpB [Phenylobacterium sp.]MBP9231563.1 ATP-dependent helicase HrpB [Phenylobacterium sp.]MBP9754370.1 ATP-dependent helicase HrpB [Phenylobacterium sp.]
MLPVEEILPALQAALVENTSAVLVAPPGAGKTTLVPLRLLDAAWLAGAKIIMLEPRRLAARAAADRMAKTLGERVGETVGYRVRMQSRISARTRIEVVTEGVFSRMILGDPTLEGVGLVIFDEFHERSLDADLGLALARDAQGLLRDDLRLLVMSATLDGAAVARLLEAPVVESQGRAFPVETRYLGRDERQRLEDRTVRAVERALAEETGSILVFLPGQGEIRRTADLLSERVRRPDVQIAPLYGALDPAEQDRAISPAPAGVRKVVLATSIAETSLTIEGVRVVIDSGVARVPRFDPASGLTRLATVRVSRAAADQRRGRAGRTEPGVAYRLWDEAETRALPAYADPEILDADLSGLALDLARWGAKDVGALAFLDAPPAAAFAEARTLLRRLEALTDDGVLTPHGEALSGMPLAPRLAHMILKAAATNQAPRAARIAALVTERNLGGRDADLRHRLESFERDRSPRARDAKALADRWAGMAGRAGKGEPLEDGLLLAFAYPERIAKARGPTGEFQLVSGRGAFVEPTDALAREKWLAIAELGGGDRRDRVLLAAPLDEVELIAAFADQLVVESRLEESGGGRLRAKQITRLGRLTLREQIDENPDPKLIAAALADRVRNEGLGALAWGPAAEALRARVGFLRAAGGDWPDLSDAALLDRLDDWLVPLLPGLRSLAALKPDALDGALRSLIAWDQQRRLDAAAPLRWTAPTGNAFTIDYAAEGGPRVDVRVQEVFGLTEHPTVAGGTPLTLSLLSPGHRPVQTTKDLPGFWKGSWKDVRSDMRGRYPKHVWPEDPANTAPTARAKPRGT